ncbi:UPF0280 family protein [Desulfovibrio sp. OttesenSCG-928-F20]|nr:UPF0280 family protein [Desulfovibrio sp. OttesenSCG-928-F20]
MRKHMGRKGQKAAGRWYRSPAPQPGEASFQVVLEQSDLWITVREDCLPLARTRALELLTEARAPISAWTQLDPAFGPALAPLDVPDHAPDIVRRMAAAARIMQVGPMAAVAGAVAEHVARGLLPLSPDCLVENGGDSMLFSSKERLVALLPDPHGKATLGLRLEAGAFPLSLCASSGTFGHSLSFGKGDLAVARSKNACLADAAATALCNRLKKPGDAGRVAEFAASFKNQGLDGVFVQCCGEIGVWGDMELVSL